MSHNALVTRRRLRKVTFDHEPPVVSNIGLYQDRAAVISAPWAELRQPNGPKID